MEEEYYILLGKDKLPIHTARVMDSLDERTGKKADYIKVDREIYLQSQGDIDRNRKRMESQIAYLAWVNRLR
jgi:hypothetical protein